MKCKSKLYCYVLTPLLCLFLVFTTFTIPTHASTTSGSENLFEYTENYVRDNFNALCRFVVKQNAIISDAIIGTWENFTSWLESSGNGDIWEQHPHSPIRTVNGVDNVEVPQDVLNVINQYVIYQIQQTPTQYKECYISSYNFLNTSQFNNYNAYKGVQEIIKNNNGYTFFISPNSLGTGTQNNTYIVTVDVSKYPVNFIGTEISGIFNSNVTLEHNWSTINMLPQNTDGIDIYMLRNSNGYIGAKAKTYQAAASNAGYSSTYTPGNGTNLLNTNSMFTSGRVNVFSNKSSNELIYLFPTINAYKNYNSGQPQPYYLTSEGLANSMSNWIVGSGTINTGTLSNANSTYSSVVNNVQSGWTAQEVLALVDIIISSSSGSGSGSSGSGSDNDGWLDLGIFGDIGKAIAKVIGAIITAIASIFEEIIGIVTQISDTLLQGVIFEFLSAFIGWLPDEIIALLTALFSVAVLFALVKLIREAF